MNDNFNPSAQAYLKSLSKLCIKNDSFDLSLYTKYDVKRGLRDLNGNGVLAGLTEISSVNAKKEVNGVLVPCEGELLYRGIDINRIVSGCIRDERFGFEETVYLLLFGDLPKQTELWDFTSLLGDYRRLSRSFVRDVIMKSTGENMMNMLARCVLALYPYDPDPDNTSTENVLRQCLQLISVLPLISVYSYHAKNYFRGSDSLIIHPPVKELSTAENILHILRPDSRYTMLEARVLDLALIIHAEHGGGNNSTFTTRVVTSSGTDTYSAIAAALGSLKGPKHGGANIKVTEMFEDLKKNVSDLDDDEQIEGYLEKVLTKEAFDRQGLIYGIGHAVYSVSDPRAELFRSFVERLSAEKGRTDEFKLYRKVELLAPQLIAKKRKMYKGISANVDFYSGFAYQLLNLPPELFTPIFAVSRVAGWSAHRIEELVGAGKIIRPAYKGIGARREYVELEKRG